MALITEAYREVLTRTHAQSKAWGNAGSLHNAFVLSLGYEDVLDYGCGKGGLDVPGLKKYDPAIPEFAKDPKPADLVVSFGVLEHIEPECLDDVLAHMASLTRQLCYMTIAPARPDNLVLADGRNAHLIQEDEDWWVERVSKHFKIRSHEVKKAPKKEKIVIYAEPYGPTP